MPTEEFTLSSYSNAKQNEITTYMPMQKMISKQNFVIGLFLVAPSAYAVEIPASMIITGTISASSDITPKENDKVLIKQENGTLTGQGIVIDSSGTYSVELSKTAAFNGTALKLNYQQGSATYKLLDAGKESSFQFNGGIFPVRLTINPTIGSLISAGSASTGGGSTTPPPSTTTPPPSTKFNSNFDVNKDGVLNQKDIDLIKQQVAQGKTTLAAADVNKDGIVNTRDIIDTIKAFLASTRRIIK